MNETIKSYAVVYIYRQVQTEEPAADYFQVSAYSAADAHSQAELRLDHEVEFDHCDRPLVVAVLPHLVMMQQIGSWQSECRDVGTELNRKYLKP